ncbi:MAG TPA: phosphate ABC transporter ATP-binding protein, partial [Cyanobacteria bacterium UBA8553]|nr:phosphate ABC transporter ATP-binding protein [Cyanobacteria bacterium UBA8553]
MRSQHSVQNKQNNAILDAQDVKVYYSGFMALRGVNMQIPERQIVAFIGPSGCGKSTLL